MSNAPQRTVVWRGRPYRLMIFGKDDRMKISIDLTPDQAAAIGSAVAPADTDGLGDYPLDPDGYVCIGL